MTRKGKIARLPRGVRNELNRRLDNGEQGTHLVAWLNGLPEVKRVLAEGFDGREINEQNLSEWKAGGFEDWVAHQEALEEARALNENTAELAVTACGPMVDNLAMVLGFRTAAVLTEWKGEVTDEYERKLRALRKLSLLVMGLRRSQHAAMRMEMELIQMKNGINDQIRESRYGEVPEPIFELYHRLWRMAGQKFGQMNLEEEVPHAANQKTNLGLQTLNVEPLNLGQEENRNIEHPTTNVQHPMGEDGEVEGARHDKPRTNKKMMKCGPGQPEGGDESEDGELRMEDGGDAKTKVQRSGKGKGKRMKAGKVQGGKHPTSNIEQPTSNSSEGQKPRTLNIEPLSLGQEEDQNI